jgi:hypothetical protein
MSRSFQFLVMFLICLATTLSQTTPRGLPSDGDQRLARSSGLTPIEIRAIRMVLGIPDSSSDRRIWGIDVNSLKLRNHVLVAEYGPPGNCLQIHVVERGAAGFVKIWSLSEIPTQLPGSHPVQQHPMRGICAQAPKPPSVYATPDHRIVVDIPVLLDPSQRSPQSYKYSFTWDGSGYKLDDQ